MTIWHLHYSINLPHKGNNVREVNAFVQFRTKKPASTSKALIGIGAFVTGIGKMIGGRVGDGITGFGLAHVVLGTLDMFRPSVRFR